MTLAEVVVFTAIAFAIFFLLAPIQRRLEAYLYKIFRTKIHRDGDVIDITDYSKTDSAQKDKPNE
jgi:uncharacterized protein (DUF697 family)